MKKTDKKFIVAVHNKKAIDKICERTVKTVSGVYFAKEALRQVAHEKLKHKTRSVGLKFLLVTEEELEKFKHEHYALLMNLQSLVALKRCKTAKFVELYVEYDLVKHTISAVTEDRKHDLSDSQLSKYENYNRIKYINSVNYKHSDRLKSAFREHMIVA
jgi:hypothetical protein